MGLTHYIATAMARARYKLLGADSYFGEIPGFKGVWAERTTLDGCRTELQEVLEDWIVIKLRDGDRLPTVGGKTLKVPSTVSRGLSRASAGSKPPWEASTEAHAQARLARGADPTLLIRRFRALGFEGPIAAAKHSFMKKGELKVRLPNPHRGDIASGLLREILSQAGIKPLDWDATA